MLVNDINGFIIDDGWGWNCFARFSAMLKFGVEELVLSGDVKPKKVQMIKYVCKMVSGDEMAVLESFIKPYYMLRLYAHT